MKIRKILQNLTGWPKKEFVLKDSFGIFWEINSSLSLDRHLVLGDECMIPTVIKSIFNILDNKSTAIDVGANAGYWAIPMSKIFNTVVAFEPNTTVREKLIRNIQINDISSIEIRPELVGAESANVEFFEISLKDGDGLWNNGLSGRLNRGLDLTANIRECIPLDSLQLSDVNFIKIDVEGYEWEVLLGARGILRNFSPLVYWEASRSLDLISGQDNVHKCLEILTDFSYSHFGFFGDSIKPINHLSDTLVGDMDILSVPNAKFDTFEKLLLHSSMENF